MQHHAQRRRKLLDQLGSGLLVLRTAPLVIRNGDVHFDFRPDSDFVYLTGFPEPQAALVVDRRGSKQRSILFVQPRDPQREIWDGRRFGARGAQRAFGVDEAYPIDELWTRLADLLEGHDRLLYRLGRDVAFDRRLQDVWRKTAAKRRRANPPAHPTIEDPLPAIAALRSIKQPEEIAALERASAATVAGHVAAMRAARGGMYEYEVQAELEAAFRRSGSRRNGYGSIVASGANACILHYHDNDRRMRGNDLLLIDAGAEIDGYTADVTRTFPVGGTFTEPQKAVYKIVLAAQKAGIRAARPGAAWDAPHKACVRALTRGLVQLGVLRGQPADLVKKAAYRPWYMHGTSHWLGLDVHDVGAYEEDGKPVRLRSGMVLTIEPGLYLGARDRHLRKELRGIGVRIEDDVLITRSGNRVLTDAAPKEVRDVEAACQPQ